MQKPHRAGRAVFLVGTWLVTTIAAQNQYQTTRYLPGNRTISSSPALLNFSPSKGGWTDHNTFPRFLADVDGDGRADIVGFGSGGVAVSLSKRGNGFDGFLEPTAWINNFCVAQGWTSQSSYPRVLGDVNGDGKADILGFTSNGVSVSFSTGTAFGPPAVLTADLQASAWPSYNIYPRFAADANSDGKADIIAFAGDGVYVALSTGAGFQKLVRWTADYVLTAGWLDQDSFPRSVADVNGDGRADIVGYAGDGVYVALSTGSSFAPKTAWLQGSFGRAQTAGAWAGPNWLRLAADVNGDGKADAIGIKNDGLYAALSNGNRFDAPKRWTYSFGIDSGPFQDGNLAPRVMADVTADKRADIVGFTADGVYLGVSTGTEITDVSELPIDTKPPSPTTFCWKTTSVRGAGVGRSQNCQAGYEFSLTDCYPKCPAGMYGVGPVCWTSCPAGFTDIGVSCAKPAPTSDAGFPWQFGDTAFDFDTGPRSRCEAKYGAGKCYRSGLMWYPSCPAGFKKVGDLVCSPVCPAGMRDDGAFCAKNSSTRGAGVGAKCPDGLVSDGALCYPACPPDFDGVGPVCWGKCTGNFPYACGAGCAKDAAACALSVADMVINTANAAASCLSFVVGGPGILSSAKAAAKVGQNATKAAVTSGMRLGSSELIKASTKIGIKAAAKSFAKSMIMNQVHPRNIPFSAFAKTNTAMLKIVNSSVKQMGYTTDAGPGFDFTALTALDPTGISSAVLAFAKYPSCDVDPFVPSSKSIDFGTVGTTPVSKTITLQVQAETTFTHITTPAHLAGCSVVPESDCVGRTLRQGQSCSITVTAEAPNANLDTEIRLYTTDYDAVPYALDVTANPTASAKCGISQTVDESVNLTSMVGAWAWGNDVDNRTITIDGKGKVTPVSPAFSWANGTVRVKDPANRVFEFALNAGAEKFDVKLSEFGEFMTVGNTDQGTRISKRQWDVTCAAGQTRYGPSCYKIPVGYEMVAHEMAGKACPNGWRDDGINCWPRWTGQDVWGQANMLGGPEQQFPLLVTHHTLPSIGCPPNFKLGALTCAAQPVSKEVKVLKFFAPIN